jgi:hypothetical protein
MKQLAATRHHCIDDVAKRMGNFGRVVGEQDEIMQRTILAETATCAADMLHQL